MALDPERLRMLAQAPVADVLSCFPEQVAMSSRALQWPGLLVWRQHGPAGELYVPPIFHHALVLKLDRSSHSLQMRVTRDGEGARPRTQRVYWAGGEIAIVPAGEAAYFSREAAGDNLHIHIEPELLVRHAASRVPSPAATLALESHFTVRDERLRLLAMTLLEVLEHPDDGDLLFVESVGRSLAAHLLGRYTRFIERTASTPRLNASQLRTVCDFIDAHLDERLPLARVADTIAMSPWHFSRCFKHATGKSPHAYLTERRMQRALALLSNTRQAVIDIGLEVGFPDPAHSRTFKRHYGVSPQTYRAAA